MKEQAIQQFTGRRAYQILSAERATLADAEREWRTKTEAHFAGIDRNAYDAQRTLFLELFQIFSRKDM